MRKNKWWLLQLFADGGEGSAAGSDGGAAAETGVSDVDAGHQRLRELGVPEHKIRKNRSYKASVAAKAPVVAEQAAEQEATRQDDAAQESTQNDQPKRMTWEEIKNDPEYQKAYQEETQRMVQQRLKKSKSTEEAMEKLRPGLDKLAMLYGMDPDAIDYAAMAKAITEDKQLSQKRAMERGLSEDVSDELDRLGLMEKRQKDQQNRTIEEQARQEHFGKLRQQSEAVKAKYPNFDLAEELKNPTFVRMVAPGVGLSVEDAYYTIHRKEIEQAALQAATEQAAKNMANAVRSGTTRPQENGAASAAPTVSAFSYKTASKEQREALKHRIRMAGARGEKIYPGQ